MKLTGERMRVQKYTSYGKLLWDVPVKNWDAHNKYIVQYDDRPTGKIYHAAGKCFRNLENAIKAAIEWKRY